MKQLLIALFLLFAWLPAQATICSVEEFSIIAIEDSGHVIQVPGTSVTTQAFATVTTTENSAAFAANTRYIRVICDGKIFFDIGAAPTALITLPWLPADTYMDRGVDPGDKIAMCDADCS